MWPVGGSGARERYTSALAAMWSAPYLEEVSAWLDREPDIERKMLLDPDIAHVVGARQAMIAGKTWTVVPQDPEHPNADVAVAVGKSILENIRGFTSARTILARAFFHGSRFARIHGTTRAAAYGDGKQRKWWVPVRLEDRDAHAFRTAITRTPDKVTAKWEEFVPRDGRWVEQTPEQALLTVRYVYQDDQSTLGFGRPLREALAWIWFGKSNIYSDTMAASGRLSRGIVRAKVQGARDAATNLPNKAVIDAWRRALVNLMQEHGVIVHDSEDDIDFHDPAAGGTAFQMITDFRNELRTMIAVLVLGSNLPSQASEGGSYALAEVQQDSTESLVQLDREALEEALTGKLMRACWHFNFAPLYELGIADQCPKLSLAQEPVQDPTERATVAEILSRMGLALAEEDLYEKTGFRKPSAGEPVLKAPQQPPLGAGLFGPGGTDNRAGF
jgi:phage gp29-like protein